MSTQERPRVIVGVTGSMASLQALRVAVVEARWRGAELHLVHAYRADAFLEPAIAADFREARGRLAHQRLRDWVAAALGALPSDLPVRETVVEGTMPGRTLLDRVRGDTDLIVVGASERRRLRRRRGGTAGYCAGRAVCLVLAVPPPRLARQLGRRPKWRWRRLERHLATGLTTTRRGTG